MWECNPRIFLLVGVIVVLAVGDLSGIGEGANTDDDDAILYGEYLCSLAVSVNKYYIYYTLNID